MENILFLLYKRLTHLFGISRSSQGVRSLEQKKVIK